MVNHRYHYYGIKGEEAWHFASNCRPGMMNWFIPKLFEGSDIVWCQGLKGGVRIVYTDWVKNAFEFRKYGYITTDPEAMKEFAWVKLRARDLN